MYGFIDGTLLCPSSMTTNGSPNLDYIFWVHQDFFFHLIVILASLSPYVHCFVSIAKTSWDAWQKLALPFAKPSCPRLLRLRECLIRAQGSHYRQIHKCCKWPVYELSLIEYLVSDDELALYVINGLSNEFRKIFYNFFSRDTPIVFEELLKSLLNMKIISNKLSLLQKTP